MGYQNLKNLTSSNKKIDDALDDKRESLIVHVGTKGLTDNTNLLNNIKKLATKSKKKSPNTALSFPNIIIRKDKMPLEKLRAYTIPRLKKYCIQKNLSLVNKGNITGNHLIIKNLHLNREGNSVSAKYLLNFTEG